jgi:dipeptidyl aminopeptidase/acylaminoacyl peptidase
MTSRTSQLLILILSLFLASSLSGQTSSLSGQVVFSRRVYSEQGPSYWQIWTWNPSNGALKALTRSPRNHFLPACTSGKITFVSSQAEEDRVNSKLWSFDPTGGEEREIGPQPVPTDHRPKPQKGCDVFAKAGSLEACGKAEDLSVSRDDKVIGHFKTDQCPIDEHGTLGKCETPIVSLKWSPDAKWLLVETTEDVHEVDYYVVSASAMKLTRVATADGALWLPGRDELLYTTPEATAPLPGARRERQVWVQQLIRFEPANGKSVAITSGVTHNSDASLCSP